MTMVESHELYMARAVALARRGYPAPNPRVGCVIVNRGAIVGEGYCAYAGGPHAEVVALSQAGSRASGSDVYVTLEPCDHHGKTPPCSLALLEADVSNVWIAVRDPNPIAQGGGSRLQSQGVAVHWGVGESEARAVNEVFLHAFQVRRPYVCIKAAVTADGFMARADGSSQWITSEPARRAGHRLRADLGAVLVGRGTVTADNPRLTARIPGVRNQPWRIVLDPEGKLAGTEQVFGEAGRVVWAVRRATSERHTTVAGIPEFDLSALLSKLFEMGRTGVLVEGGPRTIASFLEAGLVDRVELFVAPKLFGSGIPFRGSPGSNPALRLLRAQRVGPDARLTFFHTANDCGP